MEPDAVVQHQVRPAVAVDVPDPRAVIELVELRFLGHRMKLPRLGRFRPVGTDPAEPVLPVTDQFRPPVAREIRKRRRFALNPMEHEVLRPLPCSALRILVPEGLVQVHPAEHQDVGPPVPVEIVNVHEHAIARAGCRLEGHCRIELVGLGELRAGIPEGPGHNVHVSIAIDVPSRQSVAIVLVGEDEFL